MDQNEEYEEAVLLRPSHATVVERYYSQMFAAGAQLPLQMTGHITILQPDFQGDREDFYVYRHSNKCSSF